MTKQLLTMAKPTKLVSEMTAAERRQLADQLFDQAARAHKSGLEKPRSPHPGD